MLVSDYYQLECKIRELEAELEKAYKHLNESPHFCNCDI